MQRGLIPGLAVAALVLVACQEDNGRPAVSLEEAKKVAAEFSGQARFVPPPRSISDITAVLDQYKPDPSQTRALSAVADSSPPAGASDEALAAFYARRGAAASELGRLKQHLDDIRAAVRYGTRAGVELKSYLSSLLIAEMYMGNNRNAERIAKAKVDESERNGPMGAVMVSEALHALITLRLGDIQGGEKELNRARAIYENPRFIAWPGYDTAGRHHRITVQRGFGEIAEQTGRFADAERIYRAVLDDVLWLQRNETLVREYIPGLPPRVYVTKEAAASTDLVRILARQGRLVEAEAEARRFLKKILGIYGRYSIQTAAVLAGFAAVILEQGRPAEALRLADAAIDIYRRLGAGKGSRHAALMHATRARALLVQDNAVAALGAWNDARALFDGDPEERYRSVESRPGYPLTLLRAGRAGEALRLLEKITAERQRMFGDRHYDTAEARGFLATALARTGQTQRALAEFSAAVPLLLQESRRADDGESAGDRQRRRRLIFEAYMSLLTHLPAGQRAGIDPAAEAFHIADAARAGSVQQALAASAARGAVRDPELARLARQEQDAQKQIAAQFGLLASVLASPSGQQDAKTVTTLRAGIDRLRDARAALRQEIERRFPDYAALIDPRPATLADAQKLLRPREALISLYVGETETFVWAVPARGRPAFAAIPLDEKQVAQTVEQLRRSLDPNAATMGDIPAFDVALAHRLYATLLQPVADGLKEANSLLVVPHKALAQIPFGLLVTRAMAPPNDAGGALFSGYKRVPFLIRTAAVTQLPSVAALATLRRLPPGGAARRAFAGFGDPWFNPEQAAAARTRTVAALNTRGLRTRAVPLRRRSAPATQGVASAEIGILPRLPDTAEEVRSIARALHADVGADVFLGARASEQTVKSVDLSNRRVVMFATHGLVPGDLNGLTQPALALSAPSVTRAADGDGLLTMEEVLGLRLNADWVVLSACNTAAGDGAGAEAVSGLGRAFFYAGTRAVLVTNWPVETTSARVLTTDLFRRQADDPQVPRAEAMRRAMVALIDGDGFVADGKTVFSYAHPIFWAPFSVVGDGGGGAAGS